MEKTACQPVRPGHVERNETMRSVIGTVTRDNRTRQIHYFHAECVIKCIIWLMVVLDALDRHIIRHIWMQICVQQPQATLVLDIGSGTSSSRYLRLPPHKSYAKIEWNELKRFNFGQFTPLSFASCRFVRKINLIEIDWCDTEQIWESIFL